MRNTVIGLAAAAAMHIPENLEGRADRRDCQVSLSTAI
jgi:hypothetical protein